MLTDPPLTDTDHSAHHPGRPRTNGSGLVERAGSRGDRHGYSPIVIVATAEIFRHLIAIPFVVIGLAFIGRPEPIARLIAVGSQNERMREIYGSPAGINLIRFFGVVFAATSVYWAIVGTG